MVIILLEGRRHFHHISDSSLYELFCIFVTFCGLMVRILTVGFVHEMTSGRNTLFQKADELNTTGAYSIVRNPLYLGNYLILLGLSLLTQSPVVIILNTVVFVLIYLPIVLREESFLLEKFGGQYLAYAKNVNCIIPSFKNMRKPERAFNIKMVLKREHDTWFTNTLSLVFIELLREYGLRDEVTLTSMWYFLILTVGVAWTILKYMKRTDRLIIMQKD